MEQVELLTRLSEAAGAKNALHKATADIDGRVVELITEGLDGGVPVTKLATASDLSIPRIYQIKRTHKPAGKTDKPESKARGKGRGRKSKPDA